MSQIFGGKFKIFKIDLVGKKNSSVADLRPRDANFRVSEALDDHGLGLESVLVASEHPLDDDFCRVSDWKVPRTPDR